MRTLYAAVLLLLLLAVGYVLDIVDVSTQFASGALETFAGINVPDYNVAWVVKFTINLMAAGLSVYIIVSVAKALREMRR